MLNTHSKYSLRYGIKSPEEIVDFYKNEDYQTAIVTDINSTTAALSFIRYAQKKNINATVGVDIRNGLEQKYIIIAKNNRGFLEMNNFLSKYLHTKSPFPDKPSYLSNCITIYPFSKKNVSLKENERIGVHITHINQLKLIKSKTLFDKMVIAQPMTFTRKLDFNTHRLLRAIDNNCLLSKLPISEQGSEKELLISKKELYTAFKEYPQIIRNTESTIKSATLTFNFGDEAVPQNLKSYTGSEEDDLKQIRQLCEEGLDYRYSEITEEIVQRVESEIEIIQQKGYLSYFLITWDIVTYARNQGYFHVGRGSGANSIIAYILRITDVDPLELDLYFERFINLYRKNPPDFDIDFSWKDRDDVTRYIFERFPTAALLCTYNTFKYKATVRELGKVFGLPKSEIDLLSEGKINYDSADEMSKLVLKYSKYIDGLPSHLSIHAGGIVISEKPITWFSATFLPPKGYTTTQFSMLEAEDVGLYKFDILSQRGLAKIQDCLAIIKENQPNNPAHDIHDLDFFKKDEKIKNLLRQAKAIGCFYVESPAMRMLMTKLRVESYLELVAASSIIRPGVAQSGMMREYILRHKNPERLKKAHPVLLDIMPETYGVMVYQEDVIKVAHYFAGLSLAEADVLRRGMSGKFRSRSEFELVKQKFFSNCEKKKYSFNLVSEIWRQIESFAGYAFSKGHSASYAVESFQSLYLKAYYPLEYMLATINNFGGFYRTETYIHEARMLGAEIKGPNINSSNWNSRLIGKQLILGFNLIQNIEEKTLLMLLNERKEKGVFTNFQNLLNRIQIPLEQTLILIKINALRDFSASRKELLWQAHIHYNKAKKEVNRPQLFYSTPKEYTLPTLSEHKHESNFDEMELLGFPLCNPFELAAKQIENNVPSSKFKLYVNKTVGCYGYLVSIKRTKTIKNDYMLFGTFTDTEGNMIDTVHFPDSAKKYPFKGKGLYKITGKITQEFNHYSLEVKQLEKINYIPDVRYSETYEPTNNKQEKHKRSLSTSNHTS